MNKPGTDQRPLKVAIVGSGPSGFYATEALFKSGLSVQVDMYERLPVPYGLVRSGVAPDHPKLKQAIQVYANIAENPAFRLFANVTVGKDIAVQQLQSLYHAIIFTCGAESDRRLGIPGEELPGSHTATEFVGWYNGHPDYRDKIFDLSHETAVIFGQGNVAADVSRILAKTCDELRATDIAEHALEVLATSRIRDIYVIGRRGPAQAKFTSKELKEFGELENCVATVNASELELNPSSVNELEEKTNVSNKKIYELFTEFSSHAQPSNNKRRVHFSFLKSPVALLGNQRVETVRLEQNQLEGAAFNQSAKGTGHIIELQAGIVFRSIGYKGKPVPGVPFDEKRGVIPNQEGRIINGITPVPRMYVAGWIKRGPSGIIGTNRADSVATVAALLTDLDNSVFADCTNVNTDALEVLTTNGVRVVNFDDWKRIDQLEIARGLATGKPREKYTRVQQILQLLE